MTKLMVLVVDDNLVSRLLPSFILRSLSGQVQVIECESGAAALRFLESHHVTHVLLDISMPGLDGIQVAKEIKSKARSPNFRLIAYTADTLVANRSHLKSVGFDDVLLKPLKSQALLKSLGLNTTMPLRD
jgi:CheY-like chemotaxis protein